MSSDTEDADGFYFPHGAPAGLDEAVEHAKTLHTTRAVVAPSPVVVQKAVAQVNRMLSAGGARCRIVLPDAPIELVTGGAGDLIYRCGHTPPDGPHRWPA
jgi:hypothetical protein